VSGWPRVTLGDVLRHVPRPVDVQFDTMYREIGIRSHGKGLFHKAPISGAELGDKRVFFIEPGDFVLNIVFAWEGAVGLVSEGERGMIASHRFPTFRSDERRLDLRFLLLFFRTPTGIELMGRVSPGGAGRNRTLNRTAFLSLELSLPPLAEQRRLISTVDQAASEVERSIQLLNEQAREAEALLVSMAHRSDLTTIEKSRRGWRNLKLADVMRLSLDFQRVDSTSSYPNLGIYSFGKGLFIKPPIAGLMTSASSLNRVRAGQLIYSRLFAFEGAYGIVTQEFDGFFVSNEYPTFDCDPACLLPETLVAYLKPSSMWHRIAEGSKGLGDRRQRVQPEQLLQHESWLPPIDDQRQLVAVSREHDMLKAAQAARRAELDALMPAILDRAFAGAL
jgi:type I restriction enzyme, S subunit